jgi:putative DNA primase/helicase
MSAYLDTVANQARQRRPLTLREVEAMLNYVDGADDRETWLHVGMALKDEFGPDAELMWDRWSQSAANYDPKAVKACFKGFKGTGFTIGTVVKLAQQGGWKPQAAAQPSREELADLARRRAARAAKAAAEQAQREANAATAMQRAREAWQQASREGSSPYCERKLIERPESVRFTADGAVIIPAIRYDLPRDQALKGVQIIAADGSKKFTYGMEKSGAACRLGMAVVGEPVFVCEGWATGMSIRAALGYRHPVFVAFDAYNLPLVCQYVYQALPTCPLIICADDDHATKREGWEWNVGRIQAQVAMDGVMDLGAKLVCRNYPLFDKATPRTDKDTDFNDLHRLEGLQAVTEAMQIAMDCIEELRGYA